MNGITGIPGDSMFFIILAYAVTSSALVGAWAYFIYQRIKLRSFVATLTQGRGGSKHAK